tara:strand:+ start:869 stop:1048 length:180 start_codon:yes stop_codon:yes gene_type:complete
VSLTNEQIEEQMLQFAEALEKMSELTATAIEQRDQKIADLTAKIADLTARIELLENATD